MKTRTCGREASCALVLGDSSVSRLHARIELADDGLVRVEDAGSRNGTFIMRTETWVRAKRVTLCIGDRLRFGDCEVSLEQITGVFGNVANIRLEARRFKLPDGPISARLRATGMTPEDRLDKPRRNAATGKIEDA